MEIRTLLKANIRHKKGAFISVMILTLIIVATAATALGIRKNFSSALEQAQEEIGIGDCNVEISEKYYNEEILEKLRNHPLVDRAEINDVIVNVGQTVYPDSKDGNSYFAREVCDGLKLYNKDFDGFESELPALEGNEIYLPLGLRDKANCRVGDTVKLTFITKEYEFKIKGFVQEAIFGGQMIGWKQVFISNQLYNEIRDYVNSCENSENYFYKFIKIYQAGDELSSAKFQRQVNLDTGIINISAGSLTKEQSANYTSLFVFIVLDTVMGFAAVLFVIVLVIIAHSIRTEIDMEYENLGILKAQGFTNRKIGSIILLRYALAELLGMVFGVAVSVILERTLSHIFMGITAILPDKGIAFSGIALVILAVLALSALVVFFSTRKLARISPVRAISGGRDEIYFSSRLRLPIAKRGLNISIAYRAFSSSMWKYAGIVFISALLVFFTITVNVIGDAVGSRSAVEAMGVQFTDVSFRITDTEGKNHIEEIEETVEKYSRIDKKIYSILQYISLEGEHIISEMYVYPENIPGLTKGKLPTYSNEIIITKMVADTLELKIGDEVRVSGRTNEEKFIVSGLFQSTNDAGYAIVMNMEGAKRLNPDAYPTTIGFILEDTARIKEIAAELNEKYGSFGEASSFDFDEDFGSDLIVQACSAFKLMIYVFSGIFALVAIITVCSKAFLMERTDMGIYKALGFTAGRLRAQFTIRFFIITVIGSIIGAVAGHFLSNQLIDVIFSMFGITHFISRNTPMTYFTAAAFVCLCTTIFAFIVSRKIKRVDVRELIAEQ